MKDVWTMITRASLLLCSVLMIGAFSALEAQTRDYDCTCPTEALGVDNVPICIGGVNYVVEVTRCQEFGAPLLDAICLPSGFQDQYTTITKVCFVGAKPTPIDPRAVFNAILWAMDPCLNPGLFGASVPLPVGSIYCWTVMTPKCVFVNQGTGCITKCGDGCCRLARRWIRKADGSCQLDNTWSCDIPTTNCISSCTVLACPIPEQCL